MPGEPGAVPVRTPVTDPGPDAELPRAVLWDMDGTLVDTEPYWIAEEFALVESFGGMWSMDHAKQLVGNDLLVSGKYIREHGPVDLTPREIVDRLVDGVVRSLRRRVPWRPGSEALLAELREHGVPCALVTSSWAAVSGAALESLPPGSFDAVVTGDEVTHGKPDPEPYRTAAARLGIPPAECIAIEDSTTGARSATGAGVPTLVVPHVVAVPELPGAIQLPGLEGVRAQDLVKYARRVAPWT